MSVRGNIIINVASQFYAALITLVMVPIYIHWMGTEAYGLIGFFALLQGWFTLLDMGLSPAFTRQVARYRGGAATATSLRQLLRILEILFLFISTVSTVLLLTSTQFISTHWLRYENLPHSEIYNSIILMSLIVGIRCMAGPYRAALTGFEKMIWLGWANMILSSLRAVGVLLVFMLVDATPSVFFGWQLALMMVELAVVAGMTYRLMPPPTGTIPFSWEPLREIMGLSLSFAFLIAIWTVITHLDKVILSTLLTLSDYALFTIATLAANGVSMITGPVSFAVQPRLARLEAEGNAQAFIALYRQSTQVMVATAFAAGVVLAFHAEGLLWAWTGDRSMAVKAAPVLALYALSFGLLAIITPTYHLQVAKGNLRLHMLGHILLVALLAPAIALTTLRWGALGSGWSWLVCMTIYLIAWVPLIHARFTPGMHLSWLARDVLPTAIATTLATLAFWAAIPQPESRIGQACFIACGSILTLMAGAGSSSVLRTQARQFFAAWKGKAQ